MGTRLVCSDTQLCINPHFLVENPAAPDYGWTLGGVGGSIDDSLLTIKHVGEGQCGQNINVDIGELYVDTYDFKQVTQFNWPGYPAVTEPGIYSFIFTPDASPWPVGIAWAFWEVKDTIIDFIGCRSLVSYLLCQVGLTSSNVVYYEIYQLDATTFMIQYSYPGSAINMLAKISTIPPEDW